MLRAGKRAWIALMVFVCGAGCGIDAIATSGAVASSRDASLDGQAHLPDSGPGLDGAVDAGCGADLQADSLNCGRCGHSCLGDACKAGRCAPVVLVSGDPGLGAVALDATTIYFVSADSGLIRRVPIAGGPPTIVLSTLRIAHDLVLDGDRIFWADPFGAGMHVFAPAATVTLSTGGVSALATTAKGVYMIAFVQSNVNYWTRELSSATSFQNGGASPAVVVDGANAYWSAGKEIRRVPYGGSASDIDDVVSGLATAPTSMAITPTHVYWTTPSQVQRGTIDGKKSEEWIVSTVVAGETSAASLTVDASGLYWIDLVTGALRHVPLSGGPAETLATFSKQRTDAAYPRQIALSPTMIYVASPSDGTLSRIAK